MSGSMQMMPPMGPQAGGGMPQIPPQALQAMMQMMRGQGQMGMPGDGAPQMPPQGPISPSMAQGMPNAAPPQAMPGQPPQGGPPQQAGPPRMTPQEMAAKGRFGDQLVAHVTPGEISVPPEIQTPDLIAKLRQAFQHAGVDLSQFTAGSNANARNPATGAPELSFLSAILPVLGAIGGTILGGPGVGSALGGGLGGAIGGAADKQNAQGILMQALGGAGGGYLGGAFSGLGGAAASGATSLAPNSAMALENGTLNAAMTEAGQAPLASTAAGALPSAGGAAASYIPSGAAPAFGAPAAAASGGSGLSGAWNAVTSNPLAYGKIGLGAGIGSMLGGSFSGQQGQNPFMDAFNKPMNPLNKNFNQLRGSSGSSTPTFSGYNPYTAATGGGYPFYGSGP